MTTLATSNPPFPVPVRERLGEYPTAYALEDLGELGPGVPLLPVAMNPAGQLLVYGHPPERQAKSWAVQGFLVRGGRCDEVATTIGGVPVAGLNGNGLCAGQRRGISGQLQAWATHRPDLGTELWPEAESCAVGVNNVGEVAGHVVLNYEGRSVRRVFLHDGGEPRFLPSAQGEGATAIGVNEAGTVLANGACGFFATQSQALLWWGESVTVIRPPTGGGLWGAAITPAGRVCGRVVTAEGNLRAFLHEGGRTYDLNLNASYQSEALAANDARVVVGRCMDDSGRRAAFRWTPFDGMRRLEELVPGAVDWVLHKALAVNAAGWIAGTGLREGSLRGFLLRPLTS